MVQFNSSVLHYLKGDKTFDLVIPVLAIVLKQNYSTLKNFYPNIISNIRLSHNNVSFSF